MLNSRINKKNKLIEILFKFLQIVVMIFIAFVTTADATENDYILEKSQIINLNNYSESFCSAKADHFFEGLDNEKTLKFSYFKYIGSNNKELFDNETCQLLIKTIKTKCDISTIEEKELYEFFIKGNK